MAKSTRRPQAPKVRNFEAKAVRDPNGPFRPKQFKDRTKFDKPKHKKLQPNTVSKNKKGRKSEASKKNKKRWY